MPGNSIHDMAYDHVKVLQFLPSQGIIYCDLRPSIVLLDELGCMKLCNFGLPRRLKDIEKTDPRNVLQPMKGTPCCMTPELFREGGVHSYASEFWALGCVLYECYVGIRMYAARVRAQEEEARFQGREDVKNQAMPLPDKLQHIEEIYPANSVPWCFLACCFQTEGLQHGSEPTYMDGHRPWRILDQYNVPSQNGKKKGSWYPVDNSNSSLHGLQAYRVFISISMILGDSLYNFLKVRSRTIAGFISMAQNNSKGMLPVPDSGMSMPTTETVSIDDDRHTEIFPEDQFLKLVAYGGYAVVTAVSIGTLLQIFLQLKRYYILVAYVVAPVLTFCNAFGRGLTDWSLASNYGKLAIFVFGAWAGLSHGGVLVGLAACGVMMSIVSTTSDLMFWYSGFMDRRPLLRRRIWRKCMLILLRYWLGGKPVFKGGRLSTTLRS